MKPLLFINPEGTLLLDGDKPDHFFHASVNPYAKTFMAWAAKNFDVRWLTDRPPHHMFRLAEHLGLKGHEVTYSSFHDSKASAIPPQSNFFWVDTHLTPMDVAWLTEHGKMDRFLAVQNPSGIVEGHKTWLADKVNSKRK